MRHLGYWQSCGAWHSENNRSKSVSHAVRGAVKITDQKVSASLVTQGKATVLAYARR